MIDRLSGRGDLEVIRRCALSGRPLSVWEKKNTIVYGAGTALTKLLAPNAAFGATIQEELQIKSMRFGTSNTAPQRSDTALGSEATVLGTPVRVELLDANRVVGTGTVLFTALLDSTMGNGITYREAGLFTRGSDDDPQVTVGSLLYARQAFPDQAKDALVELEFRWRLTFTF